MLIKAIEVVFINAYTCYRVYIEYAWCAHMFFLAFSRLA